MKAGRELPRQFGPPRAHAEKGSEPSSREGGQDQEDEDQTDITRARAPPWSPPPPPCFFFS